MVLAFVMVMTGFLAAAPPTRAMGGSPSSTIVDRAITTAQVNTFISALTAADMVDMLRNEGPFTVFAPSDQAFQELTSGRLQFLLKPENQEELRNLLRNHIVEGKLNPTNLANLRSVTTLTKKTIPIQLQDSTVNIGGANLVQGGLEAENGYIYIIDQVLAP